MSVKHSRGKNKQSSCRLSCSTTCSAGRSRSQERPGWEERQGRRESQNFPCKDRRERLRCFPQHGQGDLAVRAWCLATIPCHRATACPIAGSPHGVSFTTSDQFGHWVHSSSHPSPALCSGSTAQLPNSSGVARSSGCRRGQGLGSCSLAQAEPLLSSCACPVQNALRWHTSQPVKMQFLQRASFISRMVN